MKRLSAVTKFAIFLFVTINHLGCNHNNHIGTWVGKSDSNESIKLIFKPNSGLEIFLSRRGDEITSYKFDYSRDPIWLDIDLSTPSWRKDKKLYCIAKFIGDDEIHIGLPIFESSERAVDLSAENIGELWILKRVN